VDGTKKKDSRTTKPAICCLYWCCTGSLVGTQKSDGQINIWKECLPACLNPDPYGTVHAPGKTRQM